MAALAAGIALLAAVVLDRLADLRTGDEAALLALLALKFAELALHLGDLASTMPSWSW